jgi:hypothetical protein
MTEDKMYHFAAGYLITLLFGFFHLPIAYGLGLAAGALKEVWDYNSGKGTPDKWDFIWTAIGATVAFCIHLAVFVYPYL